MCLRECVDGSVESGRSGFGCRWHVGAARLPYFHSAPLLTLPFPALPPIFATDRADGSRIGLTFRPLGLRGPSLCVTRLWRTTSGRVTPALFPAQILTARSSKSGNGATSCRANVGAEKRHPQPSMSVGVPVALWRSCSRLETDRERGWLVRTWTGEGTPRRG